MTSDEQGQIAKLALQITLVTGATAVFLAIHAACAMAFAPSDLYRGTVMMLLVPLLLPWVLLPIVGLSIAFRRDRGNASLARTNIVTFGWIFALGFSLASPCVTAIVGTATSPATAVLVWLPILAFAPALWVQRRFPELLELVAAEAGAEPIDALAEIWSRKYFRKLMRSSSFMAMTVAIVSVAVVASLISTISIWKSHVAADSAGTAAIAALSLALVGVWVALWRLSRQLVTRPLPEWRLGSVSRRLTVLCSLTVLLPVLIVVVASAFGLGGFAVPAVGTGYLMMGFRTFMSLHVLRRTVHWPVRLGPPPLPGPRPGTWIMPNGRLFTGPPLPPPPRG